MSQAPAKGGSRILGVGAAIAVSSVIGYLLLAIIGRLLTTTDFGLFVSYWGVLFGIASSLSMIEQEAARQSAEGDTHGRAPIHRVGVAAASLAAAAAAVTLLPPVAGRLYGDSDSRLGLLVLVATLGFAIQFTIRGLLMGSGEVRSYSKLVMAEAAARLVALLAIWAMVGVTLGAAAAAVAVGSYAWVGWMRKARRIAATRATNAQGSTASWGASYSRAGSLMVAAALTASIITGYPTMVAAFSDVPLGDAGGTIFAALTASRVPLLFVAPLQALAVPAIVRWKLDGATTVRTAHRMLLMGVLGAVTIGLVGALAAWFVGPWGVQIAFGSKFVVTPVAIASLVFSACLLALLQLMSAALVAFGSYRWMSVVWGVAAGSTALWLLLSPLGVVGSTVVGAIVGPTAGVAVGSAVLWRLTRTWSREAATSA